MASFLEKRHQYLRNGINFNQDRCLEIGALVDPILHHQDGNVFYADHLSTDDLKKQFAWDKDFDFDRLVDVDFVWDNKRPLQECVTGAFDYVIASHVGEHVPNLIGWIDQISQVLTPNGQLRLVLPDGRYSFDMKRQETRLSDLLAAWMKQSYCPDTHLVLDFALNKVDDQLVQETLLHHGTDFDPSQLCNQFSICEALHWGERTLKQNHYEDVHCWVFYLNLLAQLMIPLVENDIVRLSCVDWCDIDPSHYSYEFFLFLSLESDCKKRVASWRNLYEQTKPYQPLSVQEIRTQIERLQQENFQLKEDLRSMHASSSWRITAPLRAMMKRIKK